MLLGKQITDIAIESQLRHLVAYYSCINDRLIPRYVELGGNEEKRLRRFFKHNGRPELSDWHDAIGEYLKTH